MAGRALASYPDRSKLHVFKEVLGYAPHSTGIREHAQTGLDSAMGS